MVLALVVLAFACPVVFAEGRGAPLGVHVVGPLQLAASPSGTLQSLAPANSSKFSFNVVVATAATTTAEGGGGGGGGWLWAHLGDPEAGVGLAAWSAALRGTNGNPNGTEPSPAGGDGAAAGGDAGQRQLVSVALSIAMALTALTAEFFYGPPKSAF